MRLPIPTTRNVHGNPCIDWNHWSVRFRLWLCDRAEHWPFWAYRLLSRYNIIIYGDSEDCWCGGYELGEND